ncbi:putative Protein of unknown function (DUF1308) [Trypanosoma vivax]|uniref:DUF1308 domain-containing protein n=1 Tax=Trypanosoma vivax (strain Y486) TaxID=1055687 RepID=G0U9Q9_TRYVY|nr:hypothetical protein TRVL_01037 [Trypanosoma vivax]KAH8618986.1 putative Protein of unknown function (DUF1308) [Trypanosoma vivax]CCC52540.1 conserved hypothetical protein [Trypanosoma vivax Y486]
MELYEWQPVESRDASVDTQAVSLNLSAHTSHCSSSLSSGSSLWEGSSADERSGGGCSNAVQVAMARQTLEHLWERLEQVSIQHAGVVGILRLRHRIEAELKMQQCALQYMSDSDAAGASRQTAFQKMDIRFVETMLAALENEPCILKVFTSVRDARGDKEKRILVDLISCGGLRWVRVRAASSHRLKAEQGEPGWEAPIARLVCAARAARLPFMRTPEVVVLFSDTPPPQMTEAIQRIGARPVSCAGLTTKTGDILPLASWCSENFLPPLSFEPRFVCLDTTALVALCSEACFTDCPLAAADLLSKFHVLSEQQRRELTDPCVRSYIEPVLSRDTKWSNMRDMGAWFCKRLCPNGDGPVQLPLPSRVNVSWLEALIAKTSEGCPSATPVKESVMVRHVYEEQMQRLGSGVADNCPNWIVADVTLAEFKWILETIAGPRELCRALTLLQCCTVVSTDIRWIESREPAATHVSLLVHGRKVSQRNFLVFGLADAVGAVILSSNRQMISLALEKDISLLVASHPARALVEQKLCGSHRREGLLAPPGIEVSRSDK